MAAPLVYEKQVEIKDSSPTLEDGGTTTLRCSNCDKSLMHIWHTNPNETLGGNPLVWLVQASCCYCGDRSYITTVKGGFHPKGDDKPHANGNSDDVEPITNIVDIQRIKYKGKDVSLFVTEKAKASL